MQAAKAELGSKKVRTRCLLLELPDQFMISVDLRM